MSTVLAVVNIVLIAICVIVITMAILIRHFVDGKQGHLRWLLECISRECQRWHGRDVFVITVMITVLFTLIVLVNSLVGG
ncbi:MAG: hypothetical protein OYG31_02990 [Candidatus Kaiserbacteria bacterium]|nr:hypothetical protein [Candidatus Kaiserbacteria bacterium]